MVLSSLLTFFSYYYKMTERFQRTINNDCRILSYVCSFRGQNCTGIALIIFTFFITYCLSTLKHIYHLVLTQSIKIEDCRWGPTRARQKRSITALKPLATLCLIQPRICLACLVAKGHGWRLFSVLSTGIPTSFFWKAAYNQPLPCMVHL